MKTKKIIRKIEDTNQQKEIKKLIDTEDMYNLGITNLHYQEIIISNKIYIAIKDKRDDCEFVYYEIYKEDITVREAEILLLRTFIDEEIFNNAKSIDDITENLDILIN